MLNLSAYPRDVNGVATRVLEAGSAGMPVVFVHGAGGRADRWAHNLEALAAAGFHAYAIDLPGHGFAVKGPGVACSVPACRDFLGGFLDSIGAARAALVGTSLGGHVVAAYTAGNPDRVKAVVLAGSLGLVPVGEQTRLRVQAGLADQTLEGVRAKLQRLLGEPALVTPEMVDEDVRINNSPGAKESFSALGRYVAARLDDDVVGAQLAAARVSTLLIWGEQDQSVPLDIGRAAARLMPKARLIVLPGAGHAPYLEKPETFNRAVIEFLSGW
jgi:2-hydroxy-6-oxonona-2,4-dienedioate hydrolase